MSNKILHLVTQDGQPYGSVRKCCEKCGLGIHAMPSGHSYVDEKANYTKKFAAKYGETRCIDR